MFRGREHDRSERGRSRGQTIVSLIQDIVSTRWLARGIDHHDDAVGVFRGEETGVLGS